MDRVPPCSCMETLTSPHKSLVWMEQYLAPSMGRTRVTQTVSSGYMRYAAGPCCRKSNVRPASSYEAPAQRFAIKKDRQWLQDAARPCHPALSSPSQRCRPGLGRVLRLLSLPEPFKAPNNNLSAATQDMTYSNSSLSRWMRPPHLPSLLRRRTEPGLSPLASSLR